MAVVHLALPVLLVAGAVGAGIISLSAVIKSVFALAIIVGILYKWSEPAAVNLTPDRPKRALLTDRFEPSKVPQNLDYVIIGSGMSGLSCAAVLTRMGKRVVVLEQHDTCGGGTHVYDLGGYKFDAGLHYTIPRSAPLLQLACGTKHEPVPFERMGDATGTFDKVALGDQVLFNMKHNEEHLDRLYELFPDNRDDIDNFMRISDKLLLATPIYLASKLFPLWLQRITWRLFLRTFAKYSGRTAVDVLSEITPNKLLRSLLCGLWIDTGVRPDTGSFFLMASVFRGLPKEGGAYPTGGSDAMARALIPVIERFGGRALVRAKVQQILFEDTATGDQRAVGVVLEDGTEIRAKEGVITSVGYHNTYRKLVPEEVRAKYKIPETIPGIPDGEGFVMVNIGIKGDSQTLNIPNVNIWHHPIDSEGDLVTPLQAYYADPEHGEVATMITFPSVKDRAHESAHPGKMTCQMLMMAGYAWFEAWKDLPSSKRGEEYDRLKETWKNRALALLFRYYPQLDGRIDHINISSPLSIEHYISASQGTAIGLAPSPERYSGNPEVLRLLDMVTPVPGLLATGQDTAVTGVVMAQATGVICALRALGFASSMKFIARTILHGGERD